MGRQHGGLRPCWASWGLAVWATCVLCATTAQPLHHLPGVREYCDDEAFKATCDENEAVIMQTARYGRMSIGKCVDRKFDHMPCSHDVLNKMDMWCSGRSRCERDVSDINKLLGQQKPCPKDFRSNLEASYQCVPVLQGNPSTCSYSQTPTVVTSAPGYISRLVASDTGCGSIDKPWLLRAAPGQRINITLYDFATYLLNPDGAPAKVEKDVCLVYAVLRESPGAPTSTVCGGVSRERHVLTTVSNQLDVRLLIKKNEDQDKEVFFLLKYEAIGCPDIDMGPGGWFKRQGETAATVGCQDDDQSWQLKCEGSQWQGHVTNCTHKDVADPSSSTDGTQEGAMFPSGIAIIIMVGIAVCVGLVILLVGILILKRRRQREDKGTYHTAIAPREYQTTQPYKDTTTPADDRFLTGSGNDYYRTWQLQQHTGRPSTGPGIVHASLPQPPAHDFSHPGPTGGFYVDHEYESPKFEHTDHIPGAPEGRIQEDTTGPSHLKYFEIDPHATQPRSGPRGSTSGANTSSPGDTGKKDANFLYGRYST